MRTLKVQYVLLDEKGYADEELLTNEQATIPREGETISIPEEDVYTRIVEKVEWRVAADAVDVIIYIPA